MPAGRPRKTIDEAKLKKYAICQATDNEIASALGINVDTLHDNFSDRVAYYRDEGKAILREAQWKKAIEQKDTQMLKHLGKVYLGQRDEVVLTSEEPTVRKLLQKWEGSGSKINPNMVTYDCKDKEPEQTVCGTD